MLDRGARVVTESGGPIAHVARDLGVREEAFLRHDAAEVVDERIWGATEGPKSHGDR